jgi:hypothetical protein
MQNGRPIDEESPILLKIYGGQQRIEARLEDGDKRMDRMERVQQDTAASVHRLEGRVEGKRESSFSTALEWVQVIKELGPLLLMLMTIATAIGVHVPDWLKELPKHAASE